MPALALGLPQDTNLPQAALVERLRSCGAQLFVVGDRNQSIYTWRGALPDAMERQLKQEQQARSRAAREEAGGTKGRRRRGERARADLRAWDAEWGTQGGASPLGHRPAGT